MAAVTIPVMAKVRIGHFVEAQILESLGVDFIDESEGIKTHSSESQGQESAKQAGKNKKCNHYYESITRANIFITLFH